MLDQIYWEKFEKIFINEIPLKTIAWENSHAHNKIDLCARSLNSNVDDERQINDANRIFLQIQTWLSSQTTQNI